MSKLYRRLAATNIRNNKQFYLPYLLTGIVSVAMFYLVQAMQDNPGIDGLGGGAEDIRMILAFGVVTVGFFVSIFLFYTNSFIMKRRKKELGVYNILGMEKKHIARVLFLETLFTMGITIAGGLGFGILFNKLMTMLLYRLTRLSGNIPFYISPTACQNTVILFVLIYSAALLYNFMQIKLANPIELLHGSNTGEREPKTKMIMTLIGLAALGSGYYIAITVGDAISALSLFFVAVILVIIGTYCLFTAGSIALLKLLRRNKKYYYKAKHFTTVSGMIYRMKQNAVGLANICILSTMVLVTVSTTVCMYLGVEDSLKVRYPHEVGVTSYFTDMPTDRAALDGVVTDALKTSGRTITGHSGYMNLTATALWQNHTIKVTGIGSGTDYSITDVAMFGLFTKADYEAVYPDQIIEELGTGEVAVCVSTGFDGTSLAIEDMEYKVKQILKYPEEINYMSGVTNANVHVIVPDDAVFAEVFYKLKQNWESDRVDLHIRYDMSYDIDGTADEKLAAENAARTALEGWQSTNAINIPEFVYAYMEGREENRHSFYTLYGGLFFLGLFLGSMFLMVTVLIIFYKQISEGYEDKERYAIMEKVGMSNIEVKRAIRSQILTVFFLPIVVAVIHVAMAFPMIRMLLECLNLTNITLFAFCVAGSALIFAIIYLLVFLRTSRSYYKIVGNQV